MDYARRELADALAAQYVAGTLRGRARRRFEHLLPAHPALRESVSRWQHRIVPMAMGVESMEPPARVWAAIETRLFGRSHEQARRSRGGSVGLWRALTAAAVCVAIGLAFLPGRQKVAAAPIIVVLSPQPSAGVPARPQLVASVSRDGGPVVVEPLSPMPLDQDRVLQLWAIPGQGQPRSLGLISSRETTTIERSRVAADVTALAVSVEPPGGSPTGLPTGPVILTGALRS